MHKRLYILVEGNDDERFFKKLLWLSKRLKVGILPDWTRKQAQPSGFRILKEQIIYLKKILMIY